MTRRTWNLVAIPLRGLLPAARALCSAVAAFLAPSPDLWDVVEQMHSGYLKTISVHRSFDAARMVYEVLTEHGERTSVTMMRHAEVEQWNARVLAGRQFEQWEHENGIQRPTEPGHPDLPGQDS